MHDSTKSQKDELRFLLKDKYHLTEIQIEKIIHHGNKDLITEELKNDINLLKSGYPLDYIIGYTDFLGLKINLNHRPLIPRPETEFWTEKIINTLDKTSKVNILDIFCGSGCIGLALLKNFPNAKCTFADTNSDFLEQVKENAEINLIDQSRIQLIQSDVFNGIAGKFDLIIANPPYVSIHEVVGESTKHEPSAALFAQNNGIELIDKFLMEAKNHLEPKGRIFMEFGETQKQEISSLLKKYLYYKWTFHKDQFGKWRWVEIS